MSEHADTIRRAINYTSGNAIRAAEAHEALDALVAEIQRLRDALERVEDEAKKGNMVGLMSTIRGIAEDALAATPSEDTAQDHNYYRDADGHVIGPDVFIDGKPYGGTPLPGTPSEDAE
jgi:hypothetical protein